MTAARALLIGCGNIGALYDLGGPGVATHARALSRLGLPFDVVEPDAARAAQVTSAYGGQTHATLADVNLAGYDVVCVASSTATHAPVLSSLLAADVPLIVCEKPLATGGAALAPLGPAFAAARSIVLVNYLRRFQPGFAALAQQLRARPGGPWAGLQGIMVRYQRGFLNNAGHALDLLSFLLGTPLELEGLSVLRAVSDTFPEDPTLSVAFRWSGAPVMVLGFPDNGYVVFEIELDYRDARISITDRGDRVDWLRPDPARPSVLMRDPARSATGLIDDYMLPVLQQGLQLLETGVSRGNFPEAWDLNLKMARVLENLSPTS